MSGESSTPAVRDLAVRRADVLLFVDGAWRDSESWREILDPASGSQIGRVALADDARLKDAIDSAARSFLVWRDRTADERAAVLRVASEILEERLASITEVLSAESGKLRAEARAEVARAIDSLRWCADEATRVTGTVFAGKSRGASRTSVPTPVGVVAAFTAWNFPAFLAARKLGAILAAGCTAVLKGAEATPGTSAQIVRAISDAGAPAGVVNLVFGDPPAVAQQLVTSPKIQAVTFTGSTAVGRIIASLAAGGPKRTVLELGGHAPVIVASDADVDFVVRTTVPAKLGSAGQSCVAPTRFFVHRDLRDAFEERFAAAMSSVEAGTEFGPVISQDRLEALEFLVHDATVRGARLLCGGDRLDRPGFFFPPTVLADVPLDSLVMCEEPFGPLATVNAFEDLEDAIDAANATDYAFAGYVFTNSLDIRRRVVDSLHVSNLGINQMAPSLPDAPLGGMRASGLGYEGGRDGILAFQHLRLISESA